MNSEENIRKALEQLKSSPMWDEWEAAGKDSMPLTATRSYMTMWVEKVVLGEHANTHAFYCMTHDVFYVQPKDATGNHCPLCGAAQQPRGEL